MEVINEESPQKEGALVWIRNTERTRSSKNGKLEIKIEVKVEIKIEDIINREVAEKTDSTKYRAS